MEIDFSLLEALTAPQSHRSAAERPEDEKGQIYRDKAQSPGEEQERPQRHEEIKQDINKIIEDIAEGYKIDKYLQGIPGAEEEPQEEIKEDIGEMLNRIRKQHATEAPEAPQRPRSIGAEENTQEKDKGEEEATEAPTEYAKQIFVNLERQQKAIERAKEVYTIYYNNIVRSERLRAEILKDIRGGADPVETLKKALECIALMTGDRCFILNVTECLKDPVKKI